MPILPKRPKLSDQDDVMLPNPSKDQIEMWSRIENSLSEEDVSIKAEVNRLSDHLRQYIASTGVAKEIAAINETFKLPSDGIAILARVIGLVIMGKIHIREFVKIVHQKCEFDENNSRQIANLINQKIFFPIRDELKQIHKLPDWPGEQKANQQPAPQQPPIPQQTPEPPINGNIVNLKQ